MPVSLEKHRPSGHAELIGQPEAADAREVLGALEQEASPDEAIAELLRDASEHGKREDRVVADEIGGLSILDGAVKSAEVPLLLGEQPLDELSEAFSSIEETEGADALGAIIERIEAVEQEFAASHGEPITHADLDVLTAGEVMTGIPEFDRLDDYSPEFAGQMLLHRSSAELHEGDIVLPSDQVSSEMHELLNKNRSFRSTSSPEGTIEYDKKLAHAGTRDFGEQYGQYLYIVEPFEGDTLKWGENFGADVSRKRQAVSLAIDLQSGRPAVTDSYSGKQHNEVVSMQGFRVVKKIQHEPHYRETMLPWPVSSDALAKHSARSENRLSNVGAMGSDTTPGYGLAFPIRRTTSRKHPGKIGSINSPGTYRAGASEQNPAELRTRFDVIKQNAEYPGQSALAGMAIGTYGDPDRWKPVDVSPPIRPEQLEKDTPLPGMEDYVPPSRPVL